MRTHPIAPFDQLEPRHGVLVVDGYGVKVRVHRSHLVVEDGIGATRRTRQFARATHGLRRLVLLGHTGYVTLEAIRWLTDCGIALVHIDQDGRVLATAAGLGSDQPALRRAQALAATQPVGLEITREIIHRKLEGQARVAATIAGPEAGGQVAAFLPQLEAAGSLDQMRLAEAQAATAYFDTWTPVPVRFPTADRHRIPEHWTMVGPRRSPLTGCSRQATNPANAILNYLYALLEAEARIACLTVGLDPGVGILHTDHRSRDSLALDLIEAVRPHVDAYLLGLLRTHVFRATDFAETRQGACRVLAPLTHELATTTTAWAERLAPITEQVARQLADASPAIIRIPTPLTQTNRKSAVSRQRRRPATSRTGPPSPSTHCQECGTQVEPPQKRCTDCDTAYRTSLDHPRLARLATLRADGEDPAHGGDAARRRGSTNAAHCAQAAAWEQANPRPDPETFRRDILPGLQHCSPQRMAEATGLSRPYCTLIRRGTYTPHPRHWKGLALLAEAAAEEPPGGGGAAY